MGQKQIIVIIIFMILLGCNTNKPVKNQSAKRSNSEAITVVGVSNAKSQNTMANMAHEELMAIDRNLSAQVRNNFRSWNLKQPERWKYLADKFADEMILSSPDVAADREKISDAFLNHLKQRADIMNSDLKNKQQLIGRSIIELNYNLSFLIGIERFNKWLALSKTELQKFKLKRDSLNEIKSYAYNKIQKLK